MTELATRDLVWARKITERLRLQATNYAEAREKVLTTLTEARDGGAAELLGYASWTAYMADVFGDAPLRLERDARQELVAELSAQTMSVPAIAAVVGVAERTIQRDFREIETQGVTGVTPSPPQTMMRVNEVTGEVEDVPARHVTGMDGKEYAVPVQKKPNRRALTDSARDTGWDVRKAVEKLERIREDDRYSRNKKEVAELLRGHLIYVIETCQGMLDDLNQNEEN